MENYEIADNAVSVNINVNAHSSIQIDDMFFDPYLTDNLGKKAKYIFLTHTHYDHLSEKDIDNVITPKTKIIAPVSAKGNLTKYKNKKIFVEPNESYNLDDFEFSTMPAYNLDKDFHKKSFNWVGYKITRNEVTYAILGDTDATPELEHLKCDILFIPIGGTYTMDALQAAELTNKIKPQIAIPVHYGSIVGTSDDAKLFASKLDDDILCKTFF